MDFFIGFSDMDCESVFRDEIPNPVEFDRLEPALLGLEVEVIRRQRKDRVDLRLGQQIRHGSQLVGRIAVVESDQLRKRNDTIEVDRRIHAANQPFLTHRIHSLSPITM